MAWRIVQQPNKFLARFSEVVDSFIELDMTDEEALEVCIELGMGKKDAAAKVQMGRESPARWKEAIGIIRSIHGNDEANRFQRFGEILPSEEKNLEFDQLLGPQRS